jgi:phenylacetate-CoA ligase
MMTEHWQHPDESILDKEVRRTLELAEHSPFYFGRFGGAFPSDRAELATLPFTTKQDLRDNYPFGLLAVGPDQLATYHETSGTGGVPTPSFYTERDWDDLTERFSRKWIGIGASDLFLVRTPYAMMMTGHLAHLGARRCGATVIPGDNRSLAMPLSRVVRVLHDLGVTLTWSLPTETLLWAAAARTAGYEPGRDFPGLRALFVAGEPLSPARRARIAELWGVPVIEEYGSTETGPLAGQCPQGRLHGWADRGLFEVYDPASGVTRPYGTGQLVVTMLGREAMPLLRYNLEDEVELAPAGCPCGWALPTVRVLGRSAFQFPHQVTQLGLEQLIFSLPVEYGVMFWRARAEPDGLRVEFEVEAHHAASARAELTEAIRAQWPTTVTVVALPPGQLVPRSGLTDPADLVKPRGLFGPGEDWDRGLLYY